MKLNMSIFVNYRKSVLKLQEIISKYLQIEAYNLSAPGQDVVPPMRELRSDFKTIVVGKHLYVFGRNSYQCER